MEAFEFLMKQPADLFIIISDINMPRMNGIELRDKLQKEGDSRLRSIPYLFLTTGSSAGIMHSAHTILYRGFL